MNLLGSPTGAGASLPPTRLESAFQLEVGRPSRHWKDRSQEVPGGRLWPPSLRDGEFAKEMWWPRFVAR